ncbi:hypothetical protein ColTof4_06182 [Colletotrichum tofieldiae]|nr:hypothetical protein ColTof3_01365 [Colletotrichum tofieldiae]GKT73759.1 hypothetical protein ColTof4_06182 [Colletotrichum tofieldiae]GKT95719.1 hypothetical protein Ct61P_13569 [Colletotrichum tofieldiae]
MNNAPYLSTLEVYDTVSYRTPQHSRLEALRTLKFVNSSMDRGTMKVTLQAVPNITHFEYRHSVQNVIVDKQPTLTPQMLCQLLSNEYELTLPPPLNNRGQLAKATLPDLHRQLRTLIIDFPFYEGMEPWRNEEAIHDLRHFTKLRNLSININSIVCKAQGKQNMTINSLENIIPDNLETLEITRVGGYFQELIKNNLPNLAKVVKEGRFESLGRIEFTGYPGSKDAMIEVQSLLQKMFGWQKKLTIWVTGHVE